jgi:hypothetical protein
VPPAAVTEDTAETATELCLIRIAATVVVDTALASAAPSVRSPAATLTDEKALLSAAACLTITAAAVVVDDAVTDTDPSSGSIP